MSSVQSERQAAGLLTPTRYYLVSGAADARTPINAFDGALVAAGVGDVNLVRLSSIVPPGCRRTDAVPLAAGSLVPAAYAAITSSVPGQRIASAIGVARSTDAARAGLIMEHSMIDATRRQVEEEVLRMAVDGLGRRGLALGAFEVISIDAVVDVVGATFAAVIEL